MALGGRVCKSVKFTRVTSMQAYYLVILQGSLLTVGVSLLALLVSILFGLGGARCV